MNTSGTDFLSLANSHRQDDGEDCRNCDPWMSEALEAWIGFGI